MSLTPSLPPVIKTLETLSTTVASLNSQVSTINSGAPLNHARATGSEIGIATDSLYGHVKLSSLVQNQQVSSGIAATPAAVYSVKTSLDSLEDRVEATETTLTALTTINILKSVYPIGSVYITFNSASPATVFGFGTWERLPSGKVLIDNDTIGSTGGEATHVITIEQLPQHSHLVAVDSAGEHSHAPGTLKVKGSFKIGSSNAISYNGFNSATGGFTLSGTSDIGASTTGRSYGNTTVTLEATAPNGIEGVTTSAASHSHTATATNTGCSQAISLIQPYITVHMWKRTE